MAKTEYTVNNADYFAIFMKKVELSILLKELTMNLSKDELRKIYGKIGDFEFFEAIRRKKEVPYMVHTIVLILYRLKCTQRILKCL